MLAKGASEPSKQQVEHSEDAMPKTTVYVVDYQEIARLGIACVLYNTNDLESCGEATQSEDTFTFLFDRASKGLDHLPDVVVTELLLPGMNGIEMIKEMVSMYGDKINILVHTALAREFNEEQAFRAGAKGFVSKGPTVEPLVAAIRSVAAGKPAFSEEFAASLFRQMRSGGVRGKSGVELLSDRELEVFRCLGLGLTTRAIADRIHLSPKTIETYRENIKQKLSFANSNQLVRAAAVHVIREQEGCL